MRRKLFILAAAMLSSLDLSGCASFARGMTEAFLERGDDGADERVCQVRGNEFEGLDAYMRRQDQAAAENAPVRPTLKVLSVHGIGQHSPGYSTRLFENLSRALGLTRTSARPKQFELAHTRLPGMTLGTLRVSRHTNRSGTRDVLFYELTWDSIVAEEAKAIAFDSSGAMSFRRAPINHSMKVFLNNTAPDIMMYQGTSREPIQTSVSTAMCWMFSSSWDGLPDRTTAGCDATSPEFLRYGQDDYAFFSHSLGSRIVLDTLQAIAQEAAQHPGLFDRAQAVFRRRIPVFMLSNQLPLLQLGQPAPEVVGQIDEICTPGAPRANERLFDETAIIAITDPNDILSYSIEEEFIDKYVDSRLCPSIVNVLVNVAEVINVFGLGELASPLRAHSGYDDDDRVISLVTGGVGTEFAHPEVTETCEWIDTF